MICKTCGAELFMTFWGPMTEWGFVCRDDMNPNQDDEGQHIV